jgi:hypothetical protein
MGAQSLNKYCGPNEMSNPAMTAPTPEITRFFTMIPPEYIIDRHETAQGGKLVEANSIFALPTPSYIAVISNVIAASFAWVPIAYHRNTTEYFRQ